MGAQDFEQTAKGKTAQEAFENAVDVAIIENGTRGYTGTLAEKASFKIEVTPVGTDPREYIETCMYFDADHWSMNDKWGPACAVQTGPDEWTFFGTASA
jgi:hypothetical protein